MKLCEPMSLDEAIRVAWSYRCPTLPLTPADRVTLEDAQRVLYDHDEWDSLAMRFVVNALTAEPTA